MTGLRAQRVHAGRMELLKSPSDLEELRGSVPARSQVAQGLVARNGEDYFELITAGLQEHCAVPSCYLELVNPWAYLSRLLADRISRLRYY